MSYPYFSATLGQIGAYCNGGGDPKVYVYRCGPNSQFQIFNENNFTVTCTAAIVQCSSEGQRFVDTNNPDGYNVCVININKYEMKPVKCPNKFTYNAKLNDCVAKPADITAISAIVDKLVTNVKIVCDSNNGVLGCTEFP